MCAAQLAEVDTSVWGGAGPARSRRAPSMQHGEHVFACSESIAGLCAALTGSDATASFASTTDVGVCIVAPETNFGAADVAAPALLAVTSTMLLLRLASARLALPAASCAAFAGSMNDTDSLRSSDVTPFCRRVRVVDKMGSVGGAPTLGGKAAASSLAML